ncbi:MAG: ATP-binding protein [Chloroflexi bacterium]|nr:ATP-binding protein [Chloroflexota bacterium]MDA1004177.1 ATP-binding protein [Chloroflexota bacterium]
MDRRDGDTGAGTDVSRLHFEFERRVEARQNDLEATITQLERTIAELERSARATGAFNYSVAHDLRAPVRTISALAEAVLGELDEGGSASARDLITRIHRNASRMDALIDALLQLATASHVEPQRALIDLSALAQQELQALTDREPGRALTCTVADGIVASGDAQLVQSVLANLLANAWKFTADVESPCIEIGVREPDGGADGPMYYVRDNGIGFEMDSAEDVFLPFRRLSSAAQFECTGVGLALVHRIVTRHGGRVWAESAPGQGATFFFTLPPPA